MRRLPQLASTYRSTCSQRQRVGRGPRTCGQCIVHVSSRSDTWNGGRPRLLFRVSCSTSTVVCRLFDWRLLRETRARVLVCAVHRRREGTQNRVAHTDSRTRPPSPASCVAGAHRVRRAVPTFADQHVQHALVLRSGRYCRAPSRDLQLDE